MLIDLTEIERGKSGEYCLDIEPHGIGDPSFSTYVESGKLSASIQEAPEGYYLKYELKARVKAPCASCGEHMEFTVDGCGGLALCLEQPEERHIVLSADDLDVRFLKDEHCDLLQLFDEQVELEMPQYPRHEDMGEKCKGVEKYMEQQDSNSEEGGDHSPSPFAVLSSFIEKKKDD